MNAMECKLSAPWWSDYLYEIKKEQERAALAAAIKKQLDEYGEAGVDDVIRYSQLEAQLQQIERKTA